MVKLEYSQSSRGRRRWRWLLMAVPALFAAYGLAVPKLNAYLNELAQHDEVRRTIDREIAVATKDVGTAQIAVQMQALFHGEFAYYSDRQLFGRAERAEIERHFAKAHALLRPVLERHAEEAEFEAERQLIADAVTRRKQAARDRDEHVIRRIFNVEANHKGTIDALFQRAIARLSAGDFKMVKGIGEQVLELDPVYEFDSGFWKNAPVPE